MIQFPTSTPSSRIGGLPVGSPHVSLEIILSTVDVPQSGFSTILDSTPPALSFAVNTMVAREISLSGADPVTARKETRKELAVILGVFPAKKVSMF